MPTPLLLALCQQIEQARQSDWAHLAIADLCLDNLFVSVRLTDGSVGTAMNYDLEGNHGITRQQIDETRRNLLAELSEDPLLWDFLRRPSPSLAQQALLVSLLSALSSPILGNAEALAKLGWVLS